MLPSYTLSSLIFITLTVVHANPLTEALGRSTGPGKGTLPFRKNVYGKEIGSIIERDRARAQAFNRLEGGVLPITGATNNRGIYVADVGVGCPPTNHTLVIDTGSSVTWIGAMKPYAETETSQDTGHPFLGRYGSGNVTGEKWIDTITLSSDLVVRQQSIGVANHSEGFANHGVDGILGLGPADLTGQGVDMVPTVMDNLYSQGTISQKVLGVKLVPFCEANGVGELTFGGYDESATASPVVYTPLTTTANASRYWGINQTISYGLDIIMPSRAGIVDTGTTLIYLPSDAFQVYQSKIGATYDNTTRSYTVTQDQYDKLEPLTFHIEGESFVLPPNAQIMPRSLTNGTIHLSVSSLGTVPISGINFIMGYAFLERYYSIYDTTNKRLGFAPTRYTNSTCN